MKLFKYSRVRSIALVLLSGFVLCNTVAWAGDPLILNFGNAADGNRFDGFALREVIWPKVGDTMPSDTYDISVCWINYYGRLASEKEYIRQAIADTWEKHSFVRFVGWGHCTPSFIRGIRINIVNVPNVMGSARLGTRANGKKEGMRLNLKLATTNPSGPGILSCGNDDLKCSAWRAVHEFGHALGFAHEQNRPDRAMDPKGKFGCIPGEVGHDPQGLDGDIAIGSWDIVSILNYCNPYWDNHGELSKTDIATLKYFYDEVPRYKVFSGIVTIPVVPFDGQTYEVTLRALETTETLTFKIESIVPTSRLSKTEVTVSPAGRLFVPLVFVEATANPTQVLVFDNITLEFDLDKGLAWISSGNAMPTGFPTAIEGAVHPG